MCPNLNGKGKNFDEITGRSRHEDQRRHQTTEMLHFNMLLIKWKIYFISPNGKVDLKFRRMVRAAFSPLRYKSSLMNLGGAYNLCLGAYNLKSGERPYHDDPDCSLQYKMYIVQLVMLIAFLLTMSTSCYGRQGSDRVATTEHVKTIHFSGSVRKWKKKTDCRAAK